SAPSGADRPHLCFWTARHKRGLLPGLSGGHPKVIRGAAEKAITFHTPKSSGIEAHGLAFVKVTGVEITELEDEARSAFKSVMQPPARAWLEENVDNPDLIDAAEAAVKAAANQ